MATAAPGAPQAGLDFGRAFTFVSEDPEWLKKVLIGGVFTLACGLLVGIPFVLGYFSRTMRNVAAGVSLPLPEWDDLGGLFEEGLRLTAVYLVYTLGLALILCVIGFAILGPMLLASEGGKARDAIHAIGALGIVAFYGVVMLAALASAIYLPAALARAAMRGSVGEAFAWRENLAFIRANLSNYVLALLAYLLASFLAQFGVLLCCVGAFPAAFWSYLVLASGLGQALRLSSQPV